MKSVKQTKVISIGGKEVTVEKLSIGEVAKLFGAIQEIPQEIVGLDGMSSAEALAKIPMIIGASIPSFAPVLSVAVRGQISADEILADADLDEVMDLIIAFFEVNNVAGIIDRLKKIKALANPGAKKKA